MGFERTTPKKRTEYKKEIAKILQKHGVSDPKGHIGSAKMKALGWPERAITKALGLTMQKWLQYDSSEREQILKVFGEELSKGESG